MPAPRACTPSMSRAVSTSGSDSGGRRLEIWTSNRRRAAHTCFFFREQGDKVVEKSQLCELNPGVVDGMAEAEIKDRFPAEHARLQKEPYGGRYPRAESYHDLCVRIEPVIMELERSTSDLLLVVQSSVVRVLLGYLQGRSPHEIPHIDVPEGEVIEITPQVYGMQVKAHKFWDPILRRRKRDQVWVREQRAVSAVRAHSHSSSSLGSRSARSSQGSQGSLPSPHFGATIFPFTPVHTSANPSASASATQSPPRAQPPSGPGPGNVIPPLSLSISQEGSAISFSEDEDLDLRREQRERERVAALDKLADNLGSVEILHDPPEEMAVV